MAVTHDGYHHHHLDRACAFLFLFSFLLRRERRVLHCGVCNRAFAQHEDDKHISELVDRVVLHVVENHGLVDEVAEMDRLNKEARARGWFE